MDKHPVSPSSKKRVFQGGGSGSKLAKQKEDTTGSEVPYVDPYEGSGDVMVIDDKANINNKQKEAFPGFLDNQNNPANVEGSSVGSSNLENTSFLVPSYSSDPTSSNLQNSPVQLNIHPFNPILTHSNAQSGISSLSYYPIRPSQLPPPFYYATYIPPQLPSPFYYASYTPPMFGSESHYGFGPSYMALSYPYITNMGSMANNGLPFPMPPMTFTPTPSLPPPPSLAPRPTPTNAHMSIPNIPTSPLAYGTYLSHQLPMTPMTFTPTPTLPPPPSLAPRPTPTNAHMSIPNIPTPPLAYGTYLSHQLPVTPMTFTPAPTLPPPSSLAPRPTPTNALMSISNNPTSPLACGTYLSHQLPQDIIEKFHNLKKFDTVEDFPDHHYRSCGFGGQQPPKKWAKRIQEEWRILEKDLPDAIHVRICESRIDLLRAVIVGAEGTPYHDGLFFFDIFFPIDYPNTPPMVYYHSGGLRINPNLYHCGKVCLSLLNTWSGEHANQQWISGVSTVLQVLVSIQALVLNEKPYFNEPGYERMMGSQHGEFQSLQYNESAFTLSLRTMVNMIRKPPMHFEDFVFGHFFNRAPRIFGACKAYLGGVQVGCFVNAEAPDTGSSNNKGGSPFLNHHLAGFIPTLVQTFSQIGVKGLDKFLALADKGDKVQVPFGP